MRTIIVALLLACLFIAGCSFQGWDKTDRALFGAYVAGQVVDTMQTREIFNDDRYYETNPIIDRIGPDWLPWYKAASTYCVWWFTDKLSSGWRKMTLITVDGLIGATVYHNYKIGIRF